MNKTEKKILEKIRSGEVKMKPRWWFVAQNAGLNIVFWISVGVASLGASYLWYFLDLYRPTEWGEYAGLGLGFIFEDFPVYGSGALVVCGALGVLLSLNLGENYKKGWWRVAVTTVAMIAGGTVLILLTKTLL